MGRTARDNRPYVKPVKKIELSENNVKRRIIFVALFLIFGAFCISQAVAHLMNEPAGWSEIKVEGAAGKTSGSDFTFYYNLGQDGYDPADEKRALKNMYAVLCLQAYQLFDNYEEVQDINNIYYINRHPNEEIKVEAALYDAFEKTVVSNNRSIFLAPVYEYYNNIFFCDDDWQTFEYDPYQNEDIAEYYKEIAGFANDSSVVNIELLGDNRIKLIVSDEYLSYAKENEIKSYIDFAWMKNAFIADFLADAFIEKGYCHGMISSYDGFSRVFTADDETVSFGLNALYDNIVYPAASIRYKGSCATVSLRSYDVIDKDKYNYYTFSDGQVRTQYVDIKDGKAKTSVPQLTMTSKTKSCVDILFEMQPIFVSDVFDKSLLNESKKNNINSIFIEDNVIYYNNSDIVISDFFDKNGVKFVTSFIE